MQIETQPRTDRITLLEAFRSNPKLNLGEKIIVTALAAYSVGSGTLIATLEMLTRSLENADPDVAKSVIKGVALGTGLLVGTTSAMAGIFAHNRGWRSERVTPVETTE